MSNIFDYPELVNYIKDKHSEKAKDIADSLEIVNLVFDDIYELIADDITKNVELQSIAVAADLLKFSKDVLSVKKEIEDAKEMFFDEAEEENIINEELNIEKYHEPIDYENYSVDNTIPHTLYEDFTHTRPCSFEFRGEKYYVSSMREVLVKLCEILADENPEKIKSFITDPTMKGRKHAYFDTHQIIENDQNKNIKLQNIDVYIWVNLSCNQIKGVIRRVLNKFKYNIADFKIYIRADYSDLHKEDKDNKTDEEDKQEKIGQYVRNCFMKLKEYPFTINEIKAMQLPEWTLKTFGFSTPLIKKYDSSKSVSEQIQKRGVNRYWVDTFKLNGEDYFVTSQWQKIHRERFDEWFNSLNRG